MKYITNMKRLIIYFLVLCAFVCCTSHEEQDARGYINRSEQYIAAGEWNNALMTLDSVDIMFPKLVAMRREAKHLKDSIAYMQAQRSIEYNDALLETAESKLDSLMQLFVFEKDTAYQKVGNLIAKRLLSASNSERSYLQAYVTEDGRPFVRSVYFGSKQINHNDVSVSAGDEANTNITAIKPAHQFENHEYLTFEGDDALTLLMFIDGHAADKMTVTLSGEGSYKYALNPADIAALRQTCQLAVAFKDVNTLRHNANVAQHTIAKWQQKQQ